MPLAARSLPAPRNPGRLHALSGPGRGSLLLCLVLSFTLTACSSRINVRDEIASKVSASDAAPQKKYGKPYVVFGKTYYPLASAKGFRETGIASWYGEPFHGRKTANGETYNMYAMTAAHKHLPLGTSVRVTNLENQRQIEVRVNDRGPFVDERIIDLSRSAADKLDMVKKGTARVRIEALDSSPRTASPKTSTQTSQKTSGQKSSGQKGQTAPQKGASPGKDSPKAAAGSGGFYIQIVSLSNQAAANSVVRALRLGGIKAQVIHSTERQVWRVMAGPFNAAQAQKAQRSLREHYPDAYTVRD